LENQKRPKLRPVAPQPEAKAEGAKSSGKEYAAPTGLGEFLGWVSTKMSRLRRWEFNVKARRPQENFAPLESLQCEALTPLA
jgi:hypothetical protein